LFPNILKGVVASTARSSVQRVLVVFEQWGDMAAQRARPFADVNWTELVVAFENVRDRPITEPKEAGITRSRRVRDGLKSNVSATMKLCVWNGDGSNQRWNAGDFTENVLRSCIRCPLFPGFLQNNPRLMQACRHIGRKPKPFP
jgi:hypothetical protein